MEHALGETNYFSFIFIRSCYQRTQKPNGVSTKDARVGTHSDTDQAPRYGRTPTAEFLGWEMVLDRPDEHRRCGDRFRCRGSDQFHESPRGGAHRLVAGGGRRPADRGSLSAHRRDDRPAHRVAPRRGETREERPAHRHDGRTLPIEDSISPMTDEAGRRTGTVVVFHSIDERKRAEEALRRSEEQLQALFNQAAVGIAQLDLKGHFVLVNQRYCEIVGRPVAEIMASRLHDLIYPEDRPRTEAAFHEVAEGGADALIEKHHVRRDGSTVWTSENISIVRDSAGLPRSVVTICQDVSDRRRAEEALRRSEERLKITYERAPVGIFEVDLEGRFLPGQRGYCEVLGYSHEELLALCFQDVTHPDDLQADAALYARLLAGEIPSCRLENRCVRKDGQIVWVELTGCLIPAWGEGSAFGIGFAQDITDRKRAEEGLRQAHAELERRVEERHRRAGGVQRRPAGRDRRAHAGGGGAEAGQPGPPGDSSGHRRWPSSPSTPQAASRSGTPPPSGPSAGSNGRSWAGRCRPSPRTCGRSSPWGSPPSLRGEVHAGHETRRLRKDGSAITVSLWTAPLYDARGEPCGRMGVVEDITGRRRAEEAHGPAAADRHRPGGGAAPDRPRAARPDGAAPRRAHARAGGDRGAHPEPGRRGRGPTGCTTSPTGSGRRSTASPWSCAPRRWTTGACRRR